MYGEKSLKLGDTTKYMVINHGEKEYEPPFDWEIREMYINELKKKSTGVLALAVHYAENFERLGQDVVTAWKDAEQKEKELQEIYNRGYEDGYHLRESVKFVKIFR